MERFARVCPWHRRVLLELPDGHLRCGRARHRVDAWLVVDVETGEVLGAGRIGAVTWHVLSAIWLGPHLRLTPDVVLDLDRKHYALPLPAHPAAA